MTRTSRPLCCFCGTDKDDAKVALLFLSEIGGEPPLICDKCVMGYAAYVELHRKAPELLASLIRDHNANIETARREAQIAGRLPDGRK